MSLSKALETPQHGGGWLNTKFLAVGLEFLVSEGTSLEKGMATHSSILDWRIPWTEEPGGVQSMGLQRVGHDK